MLDMRRELQGVDRELDVHVALDLAAAARVDELLGGLRHNPVAVVVEPVNQGTNGGIFLIFDERRIIEGTYQIAAALKLLQEPLVVDVESECLRGRVKICAVNEERDPLLAYHRWISCPIPLANCEK